MSICIEIIEVICRGNNGQDRLEFPICIITTSCSLVPSSDPFTQQHVAYVDADDMHNSAHATARDVERLLINQIGVARLLNSRKGSAGRIPKDTSIRAVFIFAK